MGVEAPTQAHSQALSRLASFKRAAQGALEVNLHLGAATEIQYALRSKLAVAALAIASATPMTINMINPASAPIAQVAAAKPTSMRDWFDAKKMQRLEGSEGSLLSQVSTSFNDPDVIQANTVWEKSSAILKKIVPDPCAAIGPLDRIFINTALKTERSRNCEWTQGINQYYEPVRDAGASPAFGFGSKAIGTYKGLPVIMTNDWALGYMIPQSFAILSDTFGIKGLRVIVVSSRAVFDLAGDNNNIDAVRFVLDHEIGHTLKSQTANTIEDLYQLEIDADSYAWNCMYAAGLAAPARENAAQRVIEFIRQRLEHYHSNRGSDVNATHVRLREQSLLGLEKHAAHADAPGLKMASR
jgi:hypothetical protein